MIELYNLTMLTNEELDENRIIQRMITLLNKNENLVNRNIFAYFLWKNPNLVNDHFDFINENDTDLVTGIQEEPAYAYRDYIITCPSSVQLKANLIRKHKTDKILVKIQPGLYYDCFRNKILLSLSYSNTKALKLENIWGYFEPLLNLPSEEKQKILTGEYNREIENSIRNKILNNRTSDLNAYVTGLKRRAIQSNLNRALNEIEELQRKYAKELKNKELYSALIEQPTEITKITYLNRLIGLNYIHDMSIKTLSDAVIIRLELNHLPILYYANENLTRCLPEGRRTPEIIKELTDGTAHLYTLFNNLKITINPNEENPITHQFTYEASGTNTFYMNQHALFHEGRGCLGTFAFPLLEASREMNINKYLALIIQYLQTITPGDVLGNKTIRHAPIYKNNGEPLCINYGELSEEIYNEYTKRREVVTLWV